jgi:hypothetical protein
MPVAKTDALQPPRCKHTFLSCIALERAAAMRGVTSLVNARAFVERLLNAPPTRDGGGLHRRALAVGRGWLIATDEEFEKLTGAPAPQPDLAAQRVRRRELEAARKLRRQNESPTRNHSDVGPR